MLHMRKGATMEAEQLFAKGLSLDPQGFFYLSYAMVLDRNSKRAQAKEALEQALASGSLTPEQEQLARNTLAQWTQAP